VPAALFARAITTPHYRDGQRRPAAHLYEAALLHTALLAGAARAIVQQRVLDEARAPTCSIQGWMATASTAALAAHCGDQIHSGDDRAVSQRSAG
jgi:hypothetical protein